MLGSIFKTGLYVCRQCWHFLQFCPVMGGKGKAHTVSLAPPNAPRGLLFVGSVS